MTFVIPPVLNHRELTPEEINDVRAQVIGYLRKNGVDQGITTVIVVSAYPLEMWENSVLEMRGTTNPKLVRFSVPLRFKDGVPQPDLSELTLRPAYDPRRARGRARKK